MRNSSGGKFSLGSAFGRKSDRQPSYSGSNPANEFGGAAQSSGYQNGGGNYGNNVGYGGSGGGGGQFDGNPDSPTGTMGGGGGGGGGHQKTGSGFKLGKSIAHQSLLPSLGNKDVRALQDVIATEKGVLNHLEKLAVETQKAGSALPAYGQQEGPDLQDILSQSAQILNYLSSAFNVYAEREISMRSCYKKIREREEAFADLRARRRKTGGNAEQAQRKLEKMGPENKGLQGQNELLERLRNEMRMMDTEIVREESAIGDFKRQVIKEALSFKFGGLEELGEKLAIIGEMGKLIFEEIPLEETPPGYGRAPYGGFSKTEYAVEEAGRCLGQVKFTPAETSLKPSHLPHAQHLPVGHGHADLPRQESIAAAEEFANFPGDVPSPQQQPRAPYQNMAAPPRIPSFAITPGLGGPPGPGGHRGSGYGLDDNPYGGIEGRDEQGYQDFGGHQQGHDDGRRETLWQGPADNVPGHAHPDHLAANQGGASNRQSDGIEYAQARIASMYGQPIPPPGQQAGSDFVPTPQNPHMHGRQPAGDDHDNQGQAYEYEQQADLDRQNEQEQAAWRDQPSHPPAHINALPHPSQPGQQAHPAQLQPGQTAPQGWQPLNIRREPTPDPTRPAGDAPGIIEPPNSAFFDATPGAPQRQSTPSNPGSRPTSELVPPPTMAQLTNRAVTPGTDGGYHTPNESPELPPQALGAAESGGKQTPSGGPTQDRSSSPAPPELPPLPNHALGMPTTPSAGGLPGPGASSGQNMAGQPPTSPIASSPGGKMSAGAFRKAVPRRSDGAAGITESPGQDEMSRVVSGGANGRRLPLPPGGAPNPSGPSAGIAGASGASVGGGWQDEKRALAHRNAQGMFDNGVPTDAPPMYAPEGSHPPHPQVARQDEESLR